MMRSLERVTLLIAVLAVGTWAGGWWTIPLLAAGWILLSPVTKPWQAGFAGFVAWAALLGWSGPAAAKQELARQLAGILNLPGFVLGLATPLFAGLLAWGAASVLRNLSAYRAGRVVAPASDDAKG